MNKLSDLLQLDVTDFDRLALEIESDPICAAEIASALMTRFIDLIARSIGTRIPGLYAELPMREVTVTIGEQKILFGWVPTIPKNWRRWRKFLDTYFPFDLPILWLFFAALGDKPASIHILRPCAVRYTKITTKIHFLRVHCGLNTMEESTLNAALRTFEAVEANLVKAEKVLDLALSRIPSEVAFGESPEYDQECRDFEDLYHGLPKIDGWKPDVAMMGYNEIGQSRFDIKELDMVEAFVDFESKIIEPRRILEEYRSRFNRKRRALVRAELTKQIAVVDDCLHRLQPILAADLMPSDKVDNDAFDELKQAVEQIGMLNGSSLVKPRRWSDLQRHLSFRMVGDLQDIVKHDWPSVKEVLQKTMYGDRDPIPIEVDDIGALVSTNPTGPVATRLAWEKLSDDDFERLIFSLISTEKGYENPQWLMKTNAPDRGRDLSVDRVFRDSLSGTIRQRTIIQCKHWREKSVGVAEISTLIQHMKLWEPPRIDVHIVATSGRFTADAVTYIERHNQSDTSLRIEMWPESRLENLLASRPAIIGEFGLR